MPDRDTLTQILELARWAPSGDNTQPWRFEILADDHVVVHGFDTRDEVIYDFRGHPSHMSHGALLETLRIAATRFGLVANWERRMGDDSAPVYDVRLVPSPGLEPDPLADAITRRVVQRRPMRMTPLTEAQRTALVDAAGVEHTLTFFEPFARRLAVARLLWGNAHLRLTCPEAYHVHRDIIEWGVRYSEDRIPDQAVGVDPLTTHLMRWVMQSWRRVEFFNRYLLGTVAPRIQLDLIPALACSAHVLVTARGPLEGIDDYVRAGVAMQRVWLAASAHGLHLQPQMTPVIFRWYARSGERVSARESINQGAARLASRFEALAGLPADARIAFFCRVGVCEAPHARSTRRPLHSLMKP